MIRQVDNVYDPISYLLLHSNICVCVREVKFCGKSKHTSNTDPLFPTDVTPSATDISHKATSPRDAHVLNLISYLQTVWSMMRVASYSIGDMACVGNLQISYSLLSPNCLTHLNVSMKEHFCFCASCSLLHNNLYVQFRNTSPFFPKIS